MNNLTTEQIKEILANAPDGVKSYKSAGFNLYFSGELNQWNLSELKEILTLRERVEFYKEQYEKADIECNKLAMRIAELESQLERCAWKYNQVTAKLVSVIASTPQQSLADQHPDDEAVHAFACQMKDKLAIARSKGRGGWDNPDVCGAEDLARMLLSHLTKRNQGNYLDVANFCMMLHQRGESPSVLSKALAERDAEVARLALIALRSKLKGEDWEDDELRIFLDNFTNEYAERVKRGEL